MRTEVPLRDARPIQPVFLNTTQQHGNLLYKCPKHVQKSREIALVRRGSKPLTSDDRNVEFSSRT